MNKKKIPKQIVRCRDCKHAYLMRSRPENLVIALCTAQGETYNHHGIREVASCKRFCESFVRRGCPEVVNPMIWIV